MAVTDANQQRIVGLLLGDLHATIGTEHDQLVVENATRLWAFIDEPSQYIEPIVEDAQQEVHDFFTDTTRPTCPRHQRHPLWFHDGGWWCDKDGIREATLGDLASTRSTKKN
jgi:hypothetical protein